MHILLFFILIALIFPGLIRFLLSLIGLAIICVVIIAAAHADPAAHAEDTQKMVHTWAHLNDVCRGSNNVGTANKACAQREKLGDKLNHIKGCVYGNNGVYDPKKDGYTCN